MRRDRNDRPTGCWQKRTEGRFVVGVKGHGDGFAADAIFPSAVLFCALRRLPAIWLAGHAQATEVGVGGAISSTILPSACCPPRPAQNAHFDSNRAKLANDCDDREHNSSGDHSTFDDCRCFFDKSPKLREHEQL